MTRDNEYKVEVSFRKPVISVGSQFRACECHDEALRSEPFFIGGRPNLLHT